MSNQTEIVPVPDITDIIHTIRNQRVILDADLAKVYGVPTFRLNETVKRNRDRFPQDFLFQLSVGERDSLTSQFAISKTGRGGGAPFLITEFCSKNHQHSALVLGVFQPAKACVDERTAQ